MNSCRKHGSCRNFSSLSAVIVPVPSVSGIAQGEAELVFELLPKAAHFPKAPRLPISPTGQSVVFR